MKLEASPARKALLALGVTSSLLASVFGAEVPTPANHDIYLGFRVSEGIGSDESYIIKVGSYTTFNALAPGSTVTLSVGDPGADLSAKFGASWHTRPTLYWSAFGIGNASVVTPMTSVGRINPSVQSLVPVALDGGERQAGHNAITSVLNLTNGYRGRTATANSPTATFQPNGTGAEYYYTQVAGGALDFAVWDNIEGNFGAGASGTVLDLYRFTSSGVSHVGYFAITSGAAISFTKAGGSPSNVDTDGDGYTDAAEAIAGTSPTDPNDFFRVNSISTVAGETTGLGISPAPNRTYILEYSETLASGSWINTGISYVSPSVPPQTYVLTDTDPVRTARPKGFYRVNVSQNP